jgi:hypothetical protein
MNIPLGYAAISIISLSVLVPALPIAQLSKARRIVGQSLFLAAGSAGVLAAAVSFHEVEEQELARRGSASALILVAGTICFAAIALTFIRRRADPKEVPPQISVPPLRFDPAPALIVMVGGLLALAVIFALSSGQGRVISIANPNAFIWPSLLALGVAAMHSVLTVFLQPSDYLLDDLKRTEALARTELSSEDVLPALREIVNNFIRKNDTDFTASKAPGLSEAFDPLFEIPTGGRASVLVLLESMPGGAIGLAGPRGVGKSTVINGVCGREHADLDTSLAVIVSAPVQYSAREFLLNLYDQLCRSALGDSNAATRPIDPLVTRQAARVRLGSIVYGLIVLLAGVVILSLGAAGLLASVIPWGVVVVLIGLFFVFQSTIREAPRVHGASEFSPSLHELAREQLQEIHYQYKLGSAWSGGTKTPIGIEATLGLSRELARREMTLPEIVMSIRSFLRLAAVSGRVLVGIDELDKMESGTAAVSFINDIKGIFGVPNCFFLISISEEAMSGFERRGLPFRDVFDSSLDEVVRLGPLSMFEAEELLNRRVLNMPTPFKALLYAFTGGFARDLIRGARALVAIGVAHPDEAIDLEEAARALVGSDIKRKMLAAVYLLRGSPSDQERSAVVKWCLKAAELDEPTPQLLEGQLELLSKVEPLKTENDGKAGVIFSVALEMSSYVYFCMTLLEVFSPARLYAQGRSEEERRATVERLARVRGLFSTDVLVAWSSLSEIRGSEGLSILVPVRGFGSLVSDEGSSARQ